MEFLHAADAAFIDERYDDAIEGYNAAADEIPGNAEIYTRRAAAHLTSPTTSLCTGTSGATTGWRRRR